MLTAKKRKDKLMLANPEQHKGNKNYSTIITTNSTVMTTLRSSRIFSSII